MNVNKTIQHFTPKSKSQSSSAVHFSYIEHDAAQGPDTERWGPTQSAGARHRAPGPDTELWDPTQSAGTGKKRRGAT